MSWKRGILPYLVTQDESRENDMFEACFKEELMLYGLLKYCHARLVILSFHFPATPFPKHFYPG